jgi:hypothetical protein
MEEYNIPVLWKRDIATCGTYPDTFSRNLLWYQWSDIQKKHATSMYNLVFDRLEVLCELKRKHYAAFGEIFYGAYFNLNQVIDIDCGKQYTTTQLLKLVNDAIRKENDSYEAELAMAYDCLYGDWKD